MAESWASTPQTRKSMLGNKGRDTELELSVRRALHKHGFRYRVDFAPLPSVRSRADIVFRGSKLAIYLDGCFWHGCPIHGSIPKTNQSYWAPKLSRNRARDSFVNLSLRAEGWTVMRFWEHQSAMEIVDNIEAWLRAE